MSPLAYTAAAEDPPGLDRGVLHRSGLHQVAPTAGAGTVVGGPDRFVRADADTEHSDTEHSDTEHSDTVALQLALRLGLTPRDVVVLGFLSQGWTTAGIARELVYAESTIKKEVHIIVRRLGARNRTHAVAMAVRRAII